MFPVRRHRGRRREADFILGVGEGAYKRMQERNGHLVVMVGARTVANIFGEMRSASLRVVARKERGEDKECSSWRIGTRRK